MTEVEFVPRGQGARVRATAVGPRVLLDLAIEAGAALPHHCRLASCGTCRVEILAGRERLAPPREEERELLELFGHSPGELRLACQAVVDGEPGRVELCPTERP